MPLAKSGIGAVIQAGLKRKTEPAAINILEKVEIGGIDQWILIRGSNFSNPLLLFLHGGPGAAQISFAPRFQGGLEEHFTVVNWDQRGAGKSYSPDIPRETMTSKQLAMDAVELSKKLALRFGQDKLYLVGHSWGSVIGLNAVKMHPELYYAYISLGQVTDIQESGRIIYRYINDIAVKTRNKKALQAIEDIGFPPREVNAAAITTQVKWLEKLGGVYAVKNLKRLIIRAVLHSKDYTLNEKLNYFTASSFCFNSMFDELISTNMFEQVPGVDIPVCFILGRYDYNTPFELAEMYFHHLNAPEKELVWFEKSGHAPHFEEPERFLDTLLSFVQYIQQ